MSVAGSKTSVGAAPSVRWLVAAIALLAAILAPAALAVACLPTMSLTAPAMRGALVAGGICWLAASLALVTAWLGNRYAMPVQGVLAAMFFRLGIPLVCVVAASAIDARLGTTGLARTILGAYMVALIAETLLALRMTPRSERKTSPLPLSASHEVSVNQHG